MTTAPFLDTRPQAPPSGPPTVCHIDDGTTRSNYCLHPDHPGYLTCHTPGLYDVCPDCRLPVCRRCYELASLELAVKYGVGGGT